jgi:ornithine cyclodeaminase
MHSLRILTKDQVDLLLQKSNDPNVSPEVEIINLMADTFATFTNTPDLVQAPHRTTLQTPNHAVLYMPTRVDGMGTAMKVVGVPKNGKGGLPSTILVMDEATGELRAVVNAAALTAIRTAAGESSFIRLNSDHITSLSNLHCNLIKYRMRTGYHAFGCARRIEYAHLWCWCPKHGPC